MKTKSMIYKKKRGDYFFFNKCNAKEENEECLRKKRKMMQMNK